MAIYRPALRAVVLWLLVVVAGGVLGRSATAATTSVSVALTGRVKGPTEPVGFTGRAQITSTLLIDEFGGPPSVHLTLDLRGVTGVGATTKKRYVISGPQIMIRPLVGTDVIDFTFPFVPSGALAPIGIGNATFGIGFDVSTANVNRAAATITDP